jgi:hypothetical protein
MNADGVGASGKSGAAQQEAFEKILSANLARVVDLIKFAETKNAALLTFSAFWILALINLLASGRALPDGFAGAFLIALPVFAISAFVCVLAFLPKIDIQHRHIANESYKNLLFFSDIAQVALADYEAAARSRYFPESGASGATPGPTYIRDLAREVAVNARIADRKVRLYHGAALIMSLAIAMLVAPGLWHLARWIAG